MSTTVESAEPSARDRKRPWAALGVLGVAALAIAAARIHVQTRPVEPHLVVLPDSEPAPSEAANPVAQNAAPTTDSVKIGKPVAPR